MDLGFCSCSFKLNTAKHSSKQGQADKRLTSLRRGLFVLVVLNGHLAVTKLEISIERFRLFILNSMKKFFLFFVLLQGIMTLNAQTLSVDKVENDGSRILISNEYSIYSRMGLTTTYFTKFRLGCISSQNGKQYQLHMNISEGKLQIEKGRKILFKFDDGSILELSNIERIGPADYTYSVSQYGTTYYVHPTYSITEEQIQQIINGKVVKVRIEHDVDVVDKEIKKNKFAKHLKEAYDSILTALQTNKDIYTGF